MNIKSFKDLNTWKVAHQLVLATYKETNSFPKHEQFGLTNQIRRAVVSVTSNIAESFGRIGKKDKLRFLFMSLGSLMEVENQIEIAKYLGYLNTKTYSNIIYQLNETGKLLNGSIKSLKKNYQ